MHQNTIQKLAVTLLVIGLIIPCQLSGLFTFDSVHDKWTRCDSKALMTTDFGTHFSFKSVTKEPF